MKKIAIYVQNFNASELSITDAIKEAINSPTYQLDYELIILETDSKPSKQNEWLSCMQIAGNSLIFYYISDQEIEGLECSIAMKMLNELEDFSIKFRNYLYEEMKRKKIFQKEFDENFLQNTLIPIDNKINKLIEESEQNTHQALEKMKQSSKARIRSQNSLIDNSNEEIVSHQRLNPNTMFAAPKNNYFKKAAAEFCIGTILCGAGALLFTIEPISAGILIALGLLLYAATLYHVAKGFSEQENQNLKLA